MFKVGKISTLGLVNDDVAQGYMTHIMQRLEFILQTRGWYVHHLREFYPRSLRLLGLNVQKGEEICIRFRIPGCKQQFLPFPEVMCTVLHELAHCLCSRHDKKFWELYASLVLECERLEVKLLGKGIPLYPNCPSLMNSSSMCDKRARSDTKKMTTKRVENRARAASPFPVAGQLTQESKLCIEDSGIGTSPLLPSSGHRLGGSDLPPPTSLESRRTLLASKARERHEAYLRSLPSAQEKGTAWVTAPTPDVLPAEWDEAPPGDMAEKSRWRCFRCGYYNQEKSTHLDSALRACAMCADVEEGDPECVDVLDSTEENALFHAPPLPFSNSPSPNSFHAVPISSSSSSEHSYPGPNLSLSRWKAPVENIKKESEQLVSCPLPHSRIEEGKTRWETAEGEGRKEEIKKPRIETSFMKSSITTRSLAPTFSLHDMTAQNEKAVVEIVSDDEESHHSGRISDTILVVDD